MPNTITKRGKTSTDLEALIRESFREVVAKIAGVAETANAAADMARQALARGTADLTPLADAPEPVGAGPARKAPIRRNRTRAALASVPVLVPDDPHVGDDADPETLRSVVSRLLLERPMYLREIVAATGARSARVSGALIELERQRAKLYKLGDGNKQVWWIADDLSVTFLRANPRSKW